MEQQLKKNHRFAKIKMNVNEMWFVICFWTETGKILNKNTRFLINSILKKNLLWFQFFFSVWFVVFFKNNFGFYFVEQISKWETKWIWLFITISANDYRPWATSNALIFYLTYFYFLLLVWIKFGLVFEWKFLTQKTTCCFALHWISLKLIVYDCFNLRFIINFIKLFIVISCSVRYALLECAMNAGSIHIGEEREDGTSIWWRCFTLGKNLKKLPPKKKKKNTTWIICPNRLAHLWLWW